VVEEELSTPIRSLREMRAARETRVARQEQKASGTTDRARWRTSSVWTNSFQNPDVEDVHSWHARRAAIGRGSLTSRTS
jgi:hypothetical protein